MAYKSINQFANIIYGCIAGIIAGLVFAVMLNQMGMFPTIGKMVGIPTVQAGFIAHVGVSIITGIVFALLFYKLVAGPIGGIIYGIIYGALWWFAGPLTMLPFFLGMGFGSRWNEAAIQEALPSLVGHVVFGIVLGLVYVFLRSRDGKAHVSAE